MPAFPTTHVEDALKLQADGKVHLFELTPLGSGTIYFKNDNEVTWQGQTYEGIPVQLTGEEYSTESTPTPRLQIGQDDLDLLPFKGLINDGYLDGGTVVRKIVLLSDLLANLNVKQTTYYRIKRVESYSRTKVSLVLAPFSAAISQVLPHRQYIPPAFPHVDL